MELVIIGAIFALGLSALFAWCIWLGRLRMDRFQRVSFNAGLAGLMALPLWFVAFAGLVSQFLFVTLASVAGVLWIVASAVIVISLVVSAYVSFMHVCSRAT